MTGEMREMQILLEEIKRVEEIIRLLKNPRNNVRVVINTTSVNATENAINFIRTEYELELKKLEKRWEEIRK